jgi:hypothetical protein
MQAMTTQATPTAADRLLRDLAYVLKLAKTVKAEMILERAGLPATQPAFPPVEHDLCAC